MSQHQVQYIDTNAKAARIFVPDCARGERFVGLIGEHRHRPKGSSHLKEIKMIRYLIAATALASLGACGQNVDAPSNTTPNTQAPATTPLAVNSMSAAEFVQNVANSDAFEVQSSQLAGQRAARQDVKDFAAMMVRDHSATSRELEALAPQLNLPAPSPQLDPDRQRQLASLRDQSGEAFDDAYLDAQVAAHRDAVTLFERFIESSAAGPLRDWANATLPKLRDHLNQVQALENAT